MQCTQFEDVALTYIDSLRLSQPQLVWQKVQIVMFTFEKPVCAEQTMWKSWYRMRNKETFTLNNHMQDKKNEL